MKEYVLVGIVPGGYSLDAWKKAFAEAGIDYRLRFKLFFLQSVVVRFIYVDSDKFEEAKRIFDQIMTQERIKIALSRFSEQKPFKIDA